jgi:hypothetical protein
LKIEFDICMKEKDILIDYREHQVVLYAEKKDDSIGPVQTGSYVAKNFKDEFLLLMKHLEKSLINKLQNGEISPIFFYMTIEELTVSELSSRVRLSKRKVKMHLNPALFHKIKIDELKRYADVFNIPVANFFQIIRTQQDMNWHMGYQADLEKTNNCIISQEKTNNPFVVNTITE